MEQKTLEDLVLFPYLFACRKHDLAPDCMEYAQREVDHMSNSEFLRVLSDALEEWSQQNAQVRKP